MLKVLILMLKILKTGGGKIKALILQLKKINVNYMKKVLTILVLLLSLSNYAKAADGEFNFHVEFDSESSDISTLKNINLNLDEDRWFKLMFLPKSKKIAIELDDNLIVPSSSFYYDIFERNGTHIALAVDDLVFIFYLSNEGLYGSSFYIIINDNRKLAFFHESYEYLLLRYNKTKVLSNIFQELKQNIQEAERLGTAKRVNMLH